MQVGKEWTPAEWEELGDAGRAEAERKVENFIQEQCLDKDRKEYRLEFDEDYVVVLV